MLVRLIYIIYTLITIFKQDKLTVSQMVNWLITNMEIAAVVSGDKWVKKTVN